MKSKKTEPVKAAPPKAAPKLGKDVATFCGPIVYRVEVGAAEAAKLQAVGFRRMQSSGDRYVMGASSAVLAVHKGAK